MTLKSISKGRTDWHGDTWVGRAAGVDSLFVHILPGSGGVA